MRSEFQDIPGTQVYTGDRLRQGYHLNQFCMSLMRNDNRTRFKSGERSYLDEWPMSEAQKLAVMRRDYGDLLQLGGNIFYILKIAATDGRSVQSVVSSFTGQSVEAYAAMMLAGGREPGNAPGPAR